MGVAAVGLPENYILGRIAPMSRQTKMTMAAEQEDMTIENDTLDSS